jgi:hypothetical protein
MIDSAGMAVLLRVVAWLDHSDYHGRVVKWSRTRSEERSMFPLYGNPPGAGPAIMPTSREGVIAVIETQLIRNQWYIAAFSHEMGRELIGRTVADEPTEFYRTQARERVYVPGPGTHPAHGRSHPVPGDGKDSSVGVDRPAKRDSDGEVLLSGTSAQEASTGCSAGRRG